MKRTEIIERNFEVNKDGKVLDEYGNEYRNEEGRVEYIERENFGQECCWNCGCDDINYLNTTRTDESIGYKYECNICGHCGTEWYNLGYDETS